LFENQVVLVGINCMAPGQILSKHAHAEQNRFYSVLEGWGEIKIGDEVSRVEVGTVAWVPAGVAHTVTNTSDAPFILLVGIAPGHAD
jgi:quercetin dioxygenase-like cupin family protein